MSFIFPRTLSFQLEPSIHLILQFSVIFYQEISVILQFLASRDKCPGSLCQSPSVRAWTKTLTLAITFLPEEIGLSYCTCVFLVTMVL